MKYIRHSALLVIFGFVVFVVSLYRASLSGVMSKMGIQSSDAMLFDKAEVRSILTGITNSQCSSSLEIQQTLSYYLSNEKERAMMGLTMGEDRIECGLLLASINQESEAVYKIVRGLKYIENGLIKRKNLNLCDKAFSDEESFMKVQVVKNITYGSAKVVVGDHVDRINELIRSEQERCIDR